MDKIDIKKSGNYIDVSEGSNSQIQITRRGEEERIVSPKVINRAMRTPGMQSFEDFSNPEKRVEEEDEEDSEGGEGSEEGGGSEMSEDIEDMDGSADMVDEDNLEPSPGFSSIEEEKQDLLYKLHRIEGKGVKLSKKFSMFSDIRELRAEVHKIRKDASVDASVKMGKKILVACVSGIEFLNNRYDPFSVDLDGWSESVMLNVGEGEYDGVLERLAEKYSGRGNSPPELELLLSLAGSAMMFHLTNTMIKGPKKNRQNDAVPTTENFTSIRKQPPPIQRPAKPSAPKEVPSGAETTEYSPVREMKGPSIDMSNMAGMMNRFPPPPMNTVLKTDKLEEISSSSESGSEKKEEVFSDSASEMTKTIDTTVSASGRRRRRNVSKEQTISL